MTALNPAVGAAPGWRGTDPDGGTCVGDLGGIANRLDREAVARAEQDAADRALAEEILAEEYPDDEFTAAGRDASLRLILAGIRAERARQEAGQ